jgi:hypothetical protein
MDIAKPVPDPEPHHAPRPTKVSMGMDAAPNLNLLDIWISMDIHMFTHYVLHHNNV